MLRWVYILVLGANFVLAGCGGLEPDQDSVAAVQEEIVNSVGYATVPATSSKIAAEESVQIVAVPTATPPLAAETVESAATATNAVKVTKPIGNGNADVIFASARLVGTDTWTFAVTVQHPDTGWEDYADGWDVVLPDGLILKPDPDSPFTRLLLHPHESEQPFTRSQGNIKILEDVNSVTVRAHDLVDGFGGKEIVVDLTVESGPDFEVLR